MSGYGDTAARAAAERSKNKPAEPPKPSKPFRAKSTAGAYAMGSPGAPQKPYKKPAPPKKKDDSPKGTQGAYTMGTSGGPRVSTPPKAQESAQRRSNQKQGSNDMQDSAELREYRRKKIAAGDYRGKYYGPDQFKGDMEKLKAWRRAGSPANVNAYVNRTKEQQKGYGRGQNTEKNYRPYRGAGDGLSAPKKVYGRGPNTGK